MMDLVEKWSAFLPNTEHISPTQFCAMQLGEIRELITEMQALRAHVAELEAQIFAHESICAGRWVPVGERLPDEYRIVDVLQDDYQIEYLTTFVNGQCITDADGRPIQRVTHWRDDKLPTSSGEE